MTRRDEHAAEALRDGASAGRVVRGKRMLRLQGMPPEEIRATLETSDPEIVRRYLELHRERLRERLDDRLRALDPLGTFLTTRDDPR